MSGREKAWFPLVADIGKFNRNPTPKQAKEYEEGRISFAKAVKRMAPEAAAIIEKLQPYNLAPFDWETPQIHTLLTLNRLVQIDKHRSLIPIATGLMRARSFVVVETKLVEPGWYADFHDEGAVVADMNFPHRIPSQTKVKVHLSGTPRIAIKVVEGYGKNDLMEMIRYALRVFGTDVFPRLEQFIPKRR